MAHLLNMEQSQYSRRENGHTNISVKEWNNISGVLKCSVEDVFESSESIFISNNSTTNGSIGFNNSYQQNPDFVVDTFKKYILKLEDEILALNKTIKSLK